MRGQPIRNRKSDHNYQLTRGTIMTQRTLKSTLAEYYHDRPQGEDNEEVQEDITDILTDLRHLCIAEEIDFEQCNEQAAAHFASETGGQHERADFAGQQAREQS